MQNIYFLSFGGGGQSYVNAVNRISSEALDSNFFTHIISKSDDDLQNDTTFMSKYGEFIKNNKRGYGYWLWKPYLIKNLLDKINDNDILIYADAGCTINKNGKNQFDRYIDAINNSDAGIISFQMGLVEKNWTTKEIFVATKCENNMEIQNSGQFHAAFIMMKKCKNVINIFDEVMNVIDSNIDVISDKYNYLQSDYFQDNRHDQSILSVIRKKYTSVIYDAVPDDCNQPIWTTRYR